MKDTIAKILKQIEVTQAKAQLCFCKKYRAERETRYMFYRANINSKVADELKTWLIDNVKNIDLEKIDTDEETSIHSIKMSEISKWKNYSEDAFKLECQELGDLKKIKKNLNNFIIYFKLNDELIVGQIKRLGSSSVLMKRGYYKLGFENNTFDTLVEENHVEITMFWDFMFFIYKEQQIGLINSLPNSVENFEAIFDMYEQYQAKAKDIMRKSTFFAMFGNPDQILEIIATDRRVQKMLMNPVSQRGISEASKENIKQIKEELGDKVRFEIKGELIVLQQGNEKEALKDFIKALGYHFNKTLNGNHVIEGTPKRILE